MADTLGPNLRNPSFSKEKQDGDPSNKSGFEHLMEKLRRKEGLSSGWSETTRSLKLFLAERKIADEATKTYIGNHLETLQKAFKVHGLRGVTERLERIAVSLGLVVNPSVDHLYRTLTIEAECFRIDVVLDTGGIVKEVRVKHEGDRDGSVRCAELMKLINDGKFEEVKNHISGILAIYNIGVDKKQKSRAFFTLQCLETDLMNLAKFQSAITNEHHLILKSPLGVAVPRVAGRAMKLVYFVSPYDLVDEKSKTLSTMTIESITERSLGHSVTVHLEPSSSPHKLQNITLLSTKTQDGKSLPSFMPLNKMNSCIMPAVFTLRLSQPLPVAHSLIKTMESATGLELSEVQDISYKPLTELIIHHALKDSPYDSESLSVVLPDQKHRYSLNCCANCDDYLGAMVTKIPFLHPTDVAKVIQLLRQQSLYNTIVASCVRKHASLAGDGVLTFEVTAVSMQAVSVTFEHPCADSVTTVGFDLSDITGVRCTLSTTSSQQDSTYDQKATSVFQRCLSLPVTMRYISRAQAEKIEECIKPRSPSPPPNDIRFVPKRHSPWQLSKFGQERRAAFVESRAQREDNFIGYNTVRMGPYSNLNSHGAPPYAAANIVNAVPIPIAARQGQMNVPIPTPTSVSTPAIPQCTVKPQGMASSKVPHNSQSVISPELVEDIQAGVVDPESVPAAAIEAIKKDKIKKNPMLASLLDQGGESPEQIPNSQNSMLSQLLVDAPDPTGMTMPHKGTMQQKSQKRKRRSLGDSQGSVTGLHNQVGVSPKRLASEEDIMSSLGKGYPTLPPAEHHTSQNTIPNNMDSLLNNQPHQQQVGNFHTQTRVGGGNSLYVVSSSHQSNFTSTNPLVSSGVAPNSSPLAHARVFSEESHVSRLASSVDNFIKQESLEHSIANSSSCVSVVSTVVSASSTVTSPRTVATSFHTLTSHGLNSHAHTSAQHAQLPQPSVQPNAQLCQQAAGQRLATQQQHLASSHQKQTQNQFPPASLVPPQNMNALSQSLQKPKVSELASLLSEEPEIKKEPKFCDSKSFMEPLFPVKEEPKVSNSYSTVDDSIFKTEPHMDSDSVFRGGLESVSSNKTKSFEYDPFEPFLGTQPSVDGAFDTANAASLGMEFTDQKPVCTVSLPQPAAKHTSSNVDKHHENVQSKNSEDHPKKERKKASRESFLQGEERPDKLANVSMKININTKTNTIVRASPHRSESPVDSSHKADVKLLPGTPDIASQESSRDSDVFITHTSSTQNSAEHLNSSHKSSKRSDPSYKKKKKGSKHDNDVRHERKRKRDEEARLKAEQVKKQKVYDFDFNETEHLPPIKPTKIKIRTFDGKIQIHTATSTTSKKMSMSPLPMKASERSDSPAAGHGSSKSHKSEKSKHRHSSSRHNKAKSGSSQSGKVDKEKDSKLNKTPVVKIKPLSSAPDSASRPTVSTPQSAPVKLNSSHEHLSKTLKVQVTNISPAAVGKHAKHSPNCLLDGVRSKSLSHLHSESVKVKDTVVAAAATGSSREVLKSPLTVGGQMTDKKTVATPGSAGDKSVTVVTSGESGSKSGTVANDSSKTKPLASANSQPKHRTVLNSTNADHANTQTTVNSKPRVNSNDSSDKSKHSGTSNGASLEDCKRTNVYNSVEKSRLSSQGSDLDPKKSMQNIENKSKSGQSGENKSRAVQNSTIDSKARTLQNNTADSKLTKNSLSNSVSDSKSRNSAQSTELNRARTPTQFLSAENKVRSASSSCASGTQNNPSDGAKSRSLSASVHSVTNSAESSRSKAAGGGAEKESTKGKHEKPQNAQSSADLQRNKQQNKQRKSSLDQVISKLTKGLGDNDTPTQTKKAQDVYDQIRLEILKAGAHKQSSTPQLKMSRIGKISKQDTAVSSPVTTASSAVPAKSSPNAVNAVAKGNLSKQASPSVLSSKRGHNKEINKSSSFRIPSNKGDSKANMSKSDMRKNSTASSDSKSSAPGHATSNSSDGKEGGKRQAASTHARQNQSVNANQYQKQDSRESDEKNKRFKIDDISERLQSRHFLDAVKLSGESEGARPNQKPSTSQKHISHQVNHEKSRSKSPVIKENKHNVHSDKGCVDPANKTKVMSQSSKVNSSHRYQQSNRPKTPVDSKSSQVVPSKASARDPRKAAGDASSTKTPTSGNAGSSVATKDSAAPTTATPASPPPTFYNPAQALRKKTSEVVKPINVPLNKSAVGVDESPVSPIRHDTPPASPLMACDVSHNKENVAKAIPLNDSVFKVAAPIADPQSPDEVPPSSAPPETVKVIPKTKVIAKPSSPRSDISSPECSLIIDYPNSPEAKDRTDSAPRTIPLERSQSRSPPLQSPNGEVESLGDGEKMVKGIDCVLSPSLVTRDSPCSIDDGLMDEALSL